MPTLRINQVRVISVGNDEARTQIKTQLLTIKQDLAFDLYIVRQF